MRRRVRGDVLPTWTVVVLLVASVGVLVYQGLAILYAYQMPTLAPAAASLGASSRVSVIIAARNEVDDLAGTLDTLRVQDYSNLEVVVVDGGSTDGTQGVIDARAPRVRRIDEPPLPDRWVGKNWACWAGAKATQGDWLLFLDADVRLHPAAVRTVVAWAESEQADLATISPRVEMKGFWERLVIPFWTQMVLTYFRAPRVNRPDSSAAMANGQFLMIRRTVYEQIGGHEAVRSYVLEDVELARRVRAAGLKLRIAHAVDLAVTRMYRDPDEMFEGLLKNVHGTEFSAGRLVGFWFGLVGLFLLPLALLPLGLWAQSWPLIGMGAFLWVALFGKHVGFARALGAPAVYGLLYPAAVVYYLRLVSVSLARGLRGRPVNWKGRTYPLLEPSGPNR
ncbi:MAG: glycosyltransferase [Thermoplasmata archaeon]|jgi:chlorobactene glucosyltransferase|nr:glycosyltransferase [Thermoplasmata archaeon]